MDQPAGALRYGMRAGWVEATAEENSSGSDDGSAAELAAKLKNGDTSQ